MFARAAIGLLLTPVALFAQRGSPFALPGKTAALLIGTDTYASGKEWPKLSSPVYDATTIAKTLAADFAFDTTVVRNATKDEIVRAIVNHGKQVAGTDDWAVVFLASHGYFDDDRGQGYLVFKDSKPRGDDVARSTYLSLAELRGIVEGYRAGHVLLVIDACYAGTIDPDIRTGTDRGERGASRRDIESSILRRSQYRSRQYLTSGGKEYVPDGRAGAHSPFAAALLSALRKASVEARPITFSQIVGQMAESAVEPLPRHNSFRGHEPGGDFVLIPRSFATATSAPSLSSPSVEEPAPLRGGRDPAEPRRTSRERTEPSKAVVQVKVSYVPTGRAVSSSEEVVASARTVLQGGLAQRGVAEGKGGVCASGRVCLTIDASVSISEVGGRRTVQVTLTAKNDVTGQLLGSEIGRAGPYDATVPLGRIVERAVGTKLNALLDAALGGGS